MFVLVNLIFYYFIDGARENKTKQKQISTAQKHIKRFLHVTKNLFNIS